MANAEFDGPERPRNAFGSLWPQFVRKACIDPPGWLVTASLAD